MFRISDKKSIIAFVVAVILPGGILSANITSEAGNPSKVTIPRTATAPTLDGKLAPGEWDDAAAMTGGISQLDGIAHPRQATFWICFDDQYVYVAQRSTVMPEELKPRTPQNMRGMDSSYVVALAPGRINRGDTPSHYVIRTDVDGAHGGPEVFWQLSGVNITYPNPNWANRDISQIESAQTIDDGVWVSELAIPLETMKVNNLKDGENWGLLFARDYSAADQNAIVMSSDWRFGPGNRHYNLAFQTPIHNSFYGRLCVDQIPEPHLIDRVEVTIRREGASEPIATLTPKSQAAPDVHLAFHDQMIVDEARGCRNSRRESTRQRPALTRKTVVFSHGQGRISFATTTGRTCRGSETGSASPTKC